MTRPPGTRWRLLMLSTALAAMLAGCGSDDDDGGRLTFEELRTEVNTVCAELQEGAQAAFAELQPQDEPTAYQGAIAKLLPVVGETVSQLEDLEPPADIEARYDEAVAALRAGEEVVRDAGQTPEASATVFAGPTGPFDEANAVFGELGLSCGGGGSGEGTTGEGGGTTGEGGGTTGEGEGTSGGNG